MRYLVALVSLASCVGSIDSPVAPAVARVQTAPRLETTAWEPPAMPPLSGGTLLVTRAGKIIVGDPDYDFVWVFDAAAPLVTVKLPAGVEVGRMAEDGAGRVHVVLRRAGELATVRPDTGELVERRAVCAEPRGIAYRAASDELLVSCATGELVTLPAAGGAKTQQLVLEGDLRDVLVLGEEVVVSRLRSAELLRVTPVAMTTTAFETLGFHPAPPPFGAVDAVQRDLAANTAWRTVEAPGVGILVVHQRSATAPIVLESSTRDGGSAYGGGATPLCHVPKVLGSAISLVQPDGRVTGIGFPGALPLDAVVDSNGLAAIAVAGANALAIVNVHALPPPGPCLETATPLPMVSVPGQPVSVGLAPGGAYAIQLRSPPRLLLMDLSTRAVKWVLALPVPGPRVNAGHELFHRQTPSGLACASCHPEGREDGRVWTFEPGGPRRTQSLAGGILSTAPFHWDGALHDFGALVEDVFVGRMGGSPPSVSERAALAGWVERLAPPAPRRAAGSAARGAELFHDPAVGCSGCHEGPHFTNNTSADVGTGGTFQVPSLVGVGARAPYLHDGCAQTLSERFMTPCGGATHGNFFPDDIADFVAYLETL